MIVNKIYSLIVGVILIACVFAFKGQTFNPIFIYIAVVLTILRWFFSSTSRFAVLRMIPCMSRKGGSTQEHVSKVLEKLTMIFLSIGYITILYSVDSIKISSNAS
jgi:hypothetical protein